MLRSKATIFGMIAALVVMTGAFTAISADVRDGAATATTGDSILTVNGEPVEESAFLTRVATVEQNVVMLEAQAGNAPEGNELAESMLAILQETPVETIALASLIMDEALYQEAIARGHQPDEEQITAQIEQERETFEMIEADPEQFGVDEAAIEQYRENIEDAGGEDRYWNEHYPRVMRQQMTMQQFQMAAGQSEEEWIGVQRQAFNEADVQIDDAERIAPATVSDAGEYLNRIWELYQAEDVG